MKKLLSFFILAVMINFVSLDLTMAQAATYDIKVMTPKINKALDNRRARFAELQKMKTRLLVGENNRGYVEALKQDETVAKLVEAENHDRKIIYQAIADQNNLSNAIGIIEEVFAEVQRNKVESAQKYQTVTGQWVLK